MKDLSEQETKALYARLERSEDMLTASKATIDFLKRAIVAVGSSRDHLENNQLGLQFLGMAATVYRTIEDLNDLCRLRRNSIAGERKKLQQEYNKVLQILKKRSLSQVATRKMIEIN